MKEQRYADPGVQLYQLATHFVVHCPKCKGKALVDPEKKLKCLSCFHVEQPGHWYGAMTAYVSVKCRECHAPIRRSAPTDGIWKKLATKCDECGDECEYEASLSKHYIHNGLMTDPVYGLTLWLQDSFRDDLFWAYHYEHLEILKQYIGAKLRERGINPRNTIKNNSAMLSRLPEFIKKSSNRDGLLKLIQNLETKEE